MDEKEIRDKIQKMSDNKKMLLNESLIKMIDSVENTSNRRLLINSGFYLVILTTLMAGIFASELKYIIDITSVCGIVMSLVWLKSIDFHSKINAAKFETIKIISEELIGISVYHIEYDMLDKKIKITSYERLIPIMFLSIFILSITLTFAMILF